MVETGVEVRGSNLISHLPFKAAATYGSLIRIERIVRIDMQTVLM